MASGILCILQYVYCYEQLQSRHCSITSPKQRRYATPTHVFSCVLKTVCRYQSSSLIDGGKSPCTPCNATWLCCPSLYRPASVHVALVFRHDQGQFAPAVVHPDRGGRAGLGVLVPAIVHTPLLRDKAHPLGSYGSTKS